MKTPKQYYKEYGMKEWERLVRTPYMKLEFNTTMHFLKQFLPNKGLILDAGSGPGRYSIKLAEIGYDVIMLDISSKQLEIGRKEIEKMKDRHRIKDVVEGNISDLSMFKDNTFDAVLCLGGALSHIIREDERLKAVSELVRVAKTRAIIVVSVIGRLGVLKHELTKNQQEINEYPEVFWKLIEKGDYEGENAFTPSHFFRADELKNLFKRKLTVLKMVGLEGLAAHHNREIDELYENMPKAWQTWWKMHLKTATEPSVVDTSEHIMIVCRKH